MNTNVLRHIRLMKKTNFIKDWPKEYIFMTKYPPLMRDSQEQLEVRTVEVPYMRLYNDAMRKNPTYASERVYPAYWQQEPMAMVLAKKQYAFMQSGMDENEAYAAAKGSVDEMESAAYNDIDTLREAVGSGSRPAMLADPEVAEGLAKWQAAVAETPYEELDDADQGEIDFFVQTKVLHWSELQRERRMSDPVFALQFERLRDSLLTGEDGDAEEGITNKDDMLEHYGCDDRALLSPREKFYFDDYAHWFNKVKGAPVLKSWPQPERATMSRWIVATLAMQQVIENEDRTGLRKYLEKLRKQFFPMINAPSTADNFEIPSKEAVRQLLYDNDIGYKTDAEAENKMYVKRFYLLPKLLFPKFILEEGLQNDKERLREALSAEGSLLAEIRRAGLDESTLPEIQSALEQYAAESSVGGEGDDISVLNQLLSESSDTIKSSGPKAAVPSAMSMDAATVEDDNEGTDMVAEALDVPQFTFSNDLFDDRYAHNYVAPTTPYERDLDLVLKGSEPFSLADVSDESDMITFNETRAENLQIIRERMSTIYETKEAARRSRHWKRSGKWMGSELENAELDLIQ